jgi:zinc protease
MNLPIKHRSGIALGAKLMASLCVCAAMAVLAPRHAAAADTAPVLRATLSNGLRVIIVRNTLAPVVATSVNYLVGSDEAPAGFPGTAHAQEHMMFRGSPGLSADQLADIGSVMGGNFNANTRESLTQYLFTVPAEDLDVALHIEATRMRGVLDTRQDWDQERGAIEQEVAQDLSNPGYILYEKLRAAMFAGTPYVHDALGTRPSFDATRVEMLQQFHDAWYVPNNAILVVVGDLDPASTLEKIRALFGGISAKALPARPVFKLKAAHAVALQVDTDRPTGTQMLAMRVPGLHSPDFPALEVLSDVLSSQRFDLYGLVPQGKAISAGFALDPLPQAGLAYAEVSFSKGEDPKALEAEVRSILKKVAQQGVPPELVEAAKLQERRQAEFQKNSIEGLASIWADAVALYGLNSPDEDLARIEKVSVQDVNRVARKYLDLANAVSAVMIPQGTGRPVTASGGFGGQESISLGEAHPTQLPDWARAALERLEVKPSSIQPVVSTLPNGLTLIVQSEDVSDTVGVFGRIRNRPEIEAQVQQQGVAQLLDPLLSYGSEHLDRLAFQRALDEIGADEHAGTDFDVQVLSRDFDRGVALLADNELHPALPAAAMSVVAKQLIQIVAARLHSPGYLAQRSLRAALFPPDDPSLREATPEGVRALNLEDVRAFYRKVFRPDLTTIVVVGHVSAEQARATIEKYFGDWSASGAKPDTDLPQVPANKASTVAVPDASRVQDNVILAQNLALTRSDPDYYALELGSAVLGGGFYSTRLSIELRKNAGLVYSVGSTLQAGRTRGAYFIQYACDPQNVGKAANIAVQELRSMQSAVVGSDELLRVKALLLRRIPLAESSVDGIAHGLIERRELNLPLDEPSIAARRYIELTPAEVQDAFQKWMRPDDLVRVTQGPTPQ